MMKSAMTRVCRYTVGKERVNEKQLEHVNSTFQRGRLGTSTLHWREYIQEGFPVEEVIGHCIAKRQGGCLEE